MIETPQPETHLIFTSRNGVRAFAQKHAARDYSVSCVGDATAGLARELGFSDVVSANGAASDLIALIEMSVPKSQTILHCAGQDLRGQIVETLRERGYIAKHVEYYASQPIDKLDVDITHIDYVAFYSPLGAKTFAELARETDVSHVTALSISTATDKAIKGLNFADGLIAEKPSQAAMKSQLALDLAAVRGLD